MTRPMNQLDYLRSLHRAQERRFSMADVGTTNTVLTAAHTFGANADLMPGTEDIPQSGQQLIRQASVVMFSITGAPTSVDLLVTPDLDGTESPVFRKTVTLELSADGSGAVGRVDFDPPVPFYRVAGQTTLYAMAKLDSGEGYLIPILEWTKPPERTDPAVDNS